MNQALVVIDIQNDITKHYKDIIHGVNTAIEWAEKRGMDIVYIKHHSITAGTRTFKPDTKGADATACVKSTCFNMTKAGYTVHVISDCVTSYDLKKVDEMLDYYAKKGCEVKPLSAYMN